MYVITGNDDVFALNAKTGEILWEYWSGIDQQISTVCCGWVNRGLAMGEGTVVFRPARRQRRGPGYEDGARWCGRPPLRSGKMATPSPAHRSITTALSIAASPVGSLVCAVA